MMTSVHCGISVQSLFFEKMKVPILFTLLVVVVVVDSQATPVPSGSYCARFSSVYDLVNVTITNATQFSITNGITNTCPEEPYSYSNTTEMITLPNIGND
eukprot:PhM_4_TR4171/c0_g1_i1/m.50441